LNRRLTKSLYTKEWDAFLEILRDLRKQRGWTQERLAKKLARPQSLVAKIEAGERKLDVVQFVDYVRLLDADPVDVMRRFMQTLRKR
jgi:transcriptional regulator with XRE-family HTH domain